MAVKHKLVENRETQDCDKLNKILRALQDINANTEHGFASLDYSRFCETIVACLGTINIPKSPEDYVRFMSDLKELQEILAQACSNEQFIFTTLKALYNCISDPQRVPSPTMSIVLQLIDVKSIPMAVKWILHSGYSEQHFEQALLTLCKWLSQWTSTPNLGPLVLSFMEGLEAEHYYDILVDVTLKYIEPLFNLLILPQCRRFVAPVVYHMLRSMQHSPEAFHKIIPHVGKVLSLLKRENTDSSRTSEQEIATLCLTLMRHFPGYSIYDELHQVLKYYSSNVPYDQVLNCNSWQDKASAIIPLPYITNGKVGLNNLGNTCYMNSVLQALFMTKLFRNGILLSTKDTMPLISKMQSLFTLLQFSQRSSLSPNDILNIAKPPGFLPGHQHDSSEFLGYLLDVLHEQERITSTLCNGDGCHSLDTSETSSFSFTVVQKSFGGRALTLSKCGTCRTQSERADNFRELQLSFPNNSDNQSVQTLLNYYLQPEKLLGDNQYHCDNCGCLTDGERVTSVVDPPQRLVLTLKQFRYDPTSQQRTKILQRVNLDNQIVLDRKEYELYAAVVHCGSSVDSGHYYTFARDNTDWYKFNDCSVLQTKAEELHGLRPPETPYILFYRSLDSSEPEPVQKHELSSRLLALLQKDSTEFQAEKNRRQLKLTTTNRFNKKDDDPPPPGCGGGGLIGNSHNRFVC